MRFLRPLLVTTACFLTVPTLLILAAWLTDDLLVAQKMATDLVMPLSVLWWLTVGAALYAAVHRRWQRASIAILLALSLNVIGSNRLASALLGSIERESQQLAEQAAATPDAEKPFDAIVVLGGGTDISLLGTPQLGAGGDRIFRALQAYRGGRTGRLIVTGQALFRETVGSIHDPATSAIELLTTAGVEESDLIPIGGQTTKEEMAALQALLQSPPPTLPLSSPPRIGLITSASHIPRAIRLATDRQLNLIPIPADYRTDPVRISPREFIPSPIATSMIHQALKEWLARLVDR
jgi:uncharacterized SAM-binding protein YcdF (DUF218 family)